MGAEDRRALAMLADTFEMFSDELAGLFVDNFRRSDQQFSEKGERGELVSSFDRQLDERFFGFLAKHFPDAHVVSEETPAAWPPGEEDTWLIDPLDGTHNFLAGFPLCGAMAVLIRRRVVVCTAIFLPLERALGRSGLYIAGRGFGAWQWQTPKPIQLAVSRQADIAKAFLLLEGPTKALAASPAVARLITATRRSRSRLSACLSAVSVARGGLVPAGVDLLVSVGNQPWDNLPAALLVEEAGGKVTDHDGNPWSVENYRDLICSNGLLHQATLEILGGE